MNNSILDQLEYAHSIKRKDGAYEQFEIGGNGITGVQLLDALELYSLKQQFGNSVLSALNELKELFVKLESGEKMP